MTLAIEATDLSKTIAVGFWGRKRTLLDSVTFAVESGRTVGFVGVNGAGKSTTIKHLIGGARPTRGAVKVFGGDPRVPSVRRRFGYMPELPYLPPTLTPLEVMRLHAALNGMAAPTQRIAELLEVVGLTARAHERTAAFSKGMQTRLTLALALLSQPELLILDEPMSGLDPVGRKLVRQLLRSEAQQGRTILFSSHVLSDVEALCTDVIVIDAGRIVYSGSAGTAVGAPTGRWLVRSAEEAKPGNDAIREVRREGDTVLLVIQANSGEDAMRVAHAAGCSVMSLEPERPSLEERLLTMISGSTS